MCRVHRIQTNFCVLALILLGNVAGSVYARADDFGDLGTLKGTPSKPGRGGQKPPRTPPRSKTKPSRSKPTSRPARTTGVPGSNTRGVNLTGTWRTTDGWIVRLKQSGTRLTGTYTGEGISGTINGNFNGSAFRGNYTYHQGAVSFSGPMNLSYSAIDDRLVGTWSTGLYSEPIKAARLPQ